MKVKLYESKWDHKVKGELAYNFYNAIKDNDLEKVRDASIALLERCKGFFTILDDEGKETDEKEEYILNEIDVMIDEIQEADTEDEDVINNILNEIYDFCDEYLILIDIAEEDPDAEVFVDEEKPEENKTEE